MNRSSALPIVLALLPCAAVAQDTLVVRADNPPVWGVAPRLVEELRIGTLEGDERYQFGFIGDVVELANGEVWVVDGMAQTIRRYSPTGVHLGDVGRKGEGPGEFGGIGGMRLLPDGRVAALDWRNRRIHVFDAAGQLTGEFPAPINSISSPGAFEVDAEGGLYLRTAVLEDVPSGAIPSGPRRVVRRFWLRLSPSGEPTDTVDYATRPREGLTSTVSMLSPLGYVVQGRTDEYAVHRTLRDGRTVRIERSWTPVPYDPDEREELQVRFDFAWGPGEIPVPELKHPWSVFWIDAEGRMWIERNAASEPIPEAERDRGPGTPGLPGMPTGPAPPITWWQPAVYDVIEPNGRFLGSVTVPGGFRRQFSAAGPRIALAKGTTLWTIEQGELDEQYVVKYRIVPGGDTR